MKVRVVVDLRIERGNVGAEQVLVNAIGKGNRALSAVDLSGKIMDLPDSLVGNSRATWPAISMPGVGFGIQLMEEIVCKRANQRLVHDEGIVIREMIESTDEYMRKGRRLGKRAIGG